MTELSSNISCPSCGGRLRPRVLCCPACDLRVEGNFVSNEFASLSQEQLHFLRIFIVCEGRIRDMEAALGVSYPTIKNGIASLKKALGLESMPEGQGESDGPAVAEVLDALASGDLDYEAALKKLKG